MLLFIGISLLIGVVQCTSLTFPHDFKFGAATSAYQIEGAWNISGRSENIWDRVFHENPEFLADRSNADIACDSYNNFERDVQMVQELGLQHYRISLSWSRILPRGDSSYINEDGVNYYNKLINELLKIGVEPVVTIFHFDLPQVYQDYGGWSNSSFPDWLAEYANVAYTLFGDRVKTWLTANEPIIMCYILNNRVFKVLPMKFDPYNCLKHVLLGHAKAYWIYHDNFKKDFGGKVAIDNEIAWYEDGDDPQLGELCRDYAIGLISDPIYSKNGGWPSNIEKKINENPLPGTTGLPAFTEEERQLVKGSYDFFAFNHYSSHVVQHGTPNASKPWPFNGGYEIGVRFESRPDWISVESSFINVYPEGLRKLLNWMKNRYGDQEFFIGENGLPAFTTGLVDDDRIDYIKGYIEQIYLAITEDNVRVTGYTVWSLMDNFELLSGYTQKFGLYEVDFKDPARTRTPRKSAAVYGKIAKTKTLDL